MTVPLDCARGTVYDTAREAGSTEGAARALQAAADLGVRVEGVRLPVRVQNLRAGRHQKAAGAWSWALYDAAGREVVGSCETLREVLAARRDGRLVVQEQGYWRRGWTPELTAERTKAAVNAAARGGVE